jgi:hypothetical protein
VAEASLGAQRGIGGGACTKTGVDMGGQNFASLEASASLVEALLDARGAALCLATVILPLEGCLEGVVHAPRQRPVTAWQKKFKISILVSRRCYISTTFLRAHHVQV